MCVHLFQDGHVAMLRLCWYLDGSWDGKCTYRISGCHTNTKILVKIWQSKSFSNLHLPGASLLLLQCFKIYLHSTKLSFFHKVIQALQQKHVVPPSNDVKMWSNTFTKAIKVKLFVTALRPEGVCGTPGGPKMQWKPQKPIEIRWPIYLIWNILVILSSLLHS